MQTLLTALWRLSHGGKILVNLEPACYDGMGTPSASRKDMVYARLGPDFDKLVNLSCGVNQPSLMRPGQLQPARPCSVCRMGRSDVVARMLIELLDKDCIKAVAEALTGLRTEEAIQAVVQVSLTLASADRPDVIADVSAPPLPVSLFLFVCTSSICSSTTGEKGIRPRLHSCTAGAWPCEGVHLYGGGCAAFSQKKCGACSQRRSAL